MSSPRRRRRFEAAVGFAGLCQLVEAHAGAKIYIPRRIGAEHPFSELLGEKAAEALAEQLGGRTLTVPKIVGVLRARRDQEIWERYKAGESACELARNYGLLWRSIQKIVARVDKAGGTAAQSRAADSEQQLSFAWQNRAL